MDSLGLQKQPEMKGRKVMHSRHCKEDHAFAALLKACAKKKDLLIGARLHADILKKGLIERNPYHIGNGIIGMYAECGELLDAQQVLEKLPARHVATWNALIAGYVHHGRSSEAINCFECMRSEGLSPDAVTFCFILKACGHTMDISKGKQVHGMIVDRGLLLLLLQEDVVLGTALVEMYAKCGMLGTAREVFEELLPISDAVAWNALIAGYVESGHGHEVLECFEQMKGDRRVSADAATFLFALKACSMTQDIEKGKRIHGEIERQGLLKEDLLLGTSLIDMYAKCGDLDRAQQVLKCLPRRDEASWNALIAGYTQEGQCHKALSCFERMESEGFCANVVTFTCLLKVCGAEGAIAKGQRIHEEIVGRGSLEKDAVLGNALVSMYARCGAILKAHRVLKELPIRSAAAWCTLIAGYAQLGRNQEALNCFEEMQREEEEGLEPDAITLICILKVCGSMGSIEAGARIHGQILRLGLLEKNTLLGAALVDMYANCKMLTKAQQVLDDLPTRDTCAWNAMISGYAQQGQAMEALACFRQMLQSEEGTSPDAATFVAALKACGSAGIGEIGQGIHAEIVGRDLLEAEEDAPLLATALIDMYAKCGMLVKAQQVLEELPDQHVSAWNALISAYAQHDECREALNCVDRMKIVGISPNAITFICALRACGSMGALDKGKQIHGELVSWKNHVLGLELQQQMAIENALVDMYAKCGAFTKALELIEALPVRNIISWSSLISGYAQQGYVREALSCFEAMKTEGLSPDAVAFLSVLNACTHSGRIDAATMLFEDMIGVYGIAPNAEHCTCIIVILACFGRLDDAISMIKVVMPSSDDVTVWVALMAASRKCGNLALARLAFDEAGQADEQLIYI